MTPNEVIENLSEIGIHISRSTLLRHEKELGITPERGSIGRGIGRYTEYPAEIVTLIARLYSTTQVEYWKNRALVAEDKLKKEKSK